MSAKVFRTTGQVVSEGSDTGCGAKAEIPGQTKARNPEIMRRKEFCRH